MTTAAENPPPKKRRTPWYWRLLRTVLLLYVVLIIGAAVFQERLIFPGAYSSQGNPAAMLESTQTRPLVPLTTATQGKAVALFGAALNRNGDPRSDATTCPTILYFYGNGMCVADTVDGEFAMFRRLGCNVMIVEYIGYGMSEGSPSQKGCFEAADAAYAALAARKDINPHRIITGGWSLGGAVACHVAATHEVSGLFMFSSFTSMTDVGHVHYPFLPVSALMRHPLRTIDIIGQIKVPILIGHGTADDLIPYWMSESLRDAAKSSAGVTFFKIQNAGHNDFYTTGQADILQHLSRFILDCPAR